MKNITIPSFFDINCVSAIHAELLESLDNSAAIMVDVSDVEHIDTAGMQLLLMLHLQVKRYGAKLCVSEFSEPIVVALKLAGITELLDEDLTWGEIE